MAVQAPAPEQVKAVATEVGLSLTAPMTPAPLPRQAPFDLTHHPAMTVPCGMISGLPVGLMLIGKHFDEPTIYRATYAFEQAGDWRTM